MEIHISPVVWIYLFYLNILTEVIMNRNIYRGDLYYADLSPAVGSEQNGYRPVLVIQNNIGNKHSPTVIVAPITSKLDVKAKLPTHCYIGTDNGLELPSIVLLEQLRTIDKVRLTDYIGRIDDQYIKGINRALAISIGLIEPTPNKLIMCLCPTCVNNFFDTGHFIVRKANPNQSKKDTCTYCNIRSGFDYEIIDKQCGGNHGEKN